MAEKMQEEANALENDIERIHMDEATYLSANDTTQQG